MCVVGVASRVTVCVCCGEDLGQAGVKVESRSFTVALTDQIPDGESKYHSSLRVGRSVSLQVASLPIMYTSPFRVCPWGHWAGDPVTSVLLAATVIFRTSTQPPEGPLICMALLWCLLKFSITPVIYDHSTSMCVRNHTYIHIIENY